MKKYEIIVTEEAQRDIDIIYSNIFTISYFRDIALGIVKRIEDAIMSLTTYPERIQLMFSEPMHSEGFRKMVVKNYSVIFMIEKEKVYILNVLSNSSDIDSRMKNRIIR